MPRSNRFVTRIKKVTNRSWAGFNTRDTTIAAASQLLVSTLSLSNPGIDETHLRTVGLLGVRSDQEAASETQFGALGMYVVSDQANSVGITAIPHPITDASDDGWFLYVPFIARFRFADATGSADNGYNLFAFDTKAKRIVHDGSNISVVIQNSGVVGISFSLIMRTLSMVRGT